jgi:rod shape-determining protein MreC
LYLPDLFWKYKRPITLAALLGVSCLVMVDSLQERWVARAGGQLVHTTAYPIQKTSQSAGEGAGYVLSLLPDIFRVKAQNSALRQRVGALEHEVATLREAIFHGQNLVDIAEFSRDIEGRKLTARVIGASPTAWFNVVIVDRGSSDGVERFMPVVSASGVAGYIMEVYRYSSKVMLLTDPNSKISVISQRSRARGVVQGSEVRGCVLKYVETTADLAEGDILITSGNSRIYPEGLIVGRIKHLAKRPGEFFQEALVAPETDFARLELVAIILESRTLEGIGLEVETPGKGQTR